MLRINLLERIIVEKPFEKTSFGWTIYTNSDLVRRKLFTQTVNLFVNDVRKKRRLYRKILQGPFFGDVLTSKGLKRFRKGRPLRSEDVKLSVFKSIEDSHEINGINGVYRGDGLGGLIHGLNEAFSSLGVEFGLQSIPFAPRSIFRMRFRTKKEQSLLSQVSGEQMRLAFKSGNKSLNEFREGQVYRESLIVRAYNNPQKGKRREVMSESYITEELGFTRLIRPTAKLHEERRYVFSPNPNEDGVIFPVVTEDDLHQLDVETDYIPQAVAATFERDSLVKEGRIIPVSTAGDKKVYLTRRALAIRSERGEVFKLQRDGKVIYVTAESAWKHCDDGAILLDRRSWGASDVLLEYLHGTALTTSDRRSYPLLACAIDVMNTLPQGTDKYFEAARIAAQHGASETVLAALLFQRELGEQHILSSVGNGYEDISIADHLFEVYRSYGISERDWKKRMRIVIDIVQRIRQARAFDIGLFKVEGSKAVQVALQIFINALHPRVGDMDPKDVQLAYFANELGELKFKKIGALSLSEIRNLRLVVAPMAERAELRDIADQIRNEMFRISNNDEYVRMKSEIIRSKGMSYTEMQRHIQDTAVYIEKVLADVGISEDKYDIVLRAKLPYSAWEKMKGRSIDNPALIWDILGFRIVTESDYLARRIADIITKILPPLDDPAFKDKHALLLFLKGIEKSMFNNQILHPRKSGWSGITLLRLTRKNLPIEAQVTSRRRNIVNTKGEAAHWKYKVRKEVYAFYGIKIGESMYVSDFDQNLRVILFGQFNGSIMATLENGLRHVVVDDVSLNSLKNDYGFGKADKVLCAPYWDVVQAARPNIDIFSPLTQWATPALPDAPIAMPQVMIMINMP